MFYWRCVLKYVCKVFRTHQQHALMLFVGFIENVLAEILQSTVSFAESNTSRQGIKMPSYSEWFFLPDDATSISCNWYECSTLEECCFMLNIQWAVSVLSAFWYFVNQDGVCSYLWKFLLLSWVKTQNTFSLVADRQYMLDKAVGKVLENLFVLW